MAINAELGGDLVRALDALADGLDDRERLRGEIAVATAQARFAARVRAGRAAARPGDARRALARPRSRRSSRRWPGRALVGVSLVLDLAAVLLLRRIARGVEA